MTIDQRKAMVTSLLPQEFETFRQELSKSNVSAKILHRYIEHFSLIVTMAKQGHFPWQLKTLDTIFSKELANEADAALYEKYDRSIGELARETEAIKTLEPVTFGSVVCGFIAFIIMALMCLGMLALGIFTLGFLLFGL